MKRVFGRLLALAAVGLLSVTPPSNRVTIAFVGDVDGGWLVAFSNGEQTFATFREGNGDGVPTPGEIVPIGSSPWSSAFLAGGDWFDKSDLTDESYEN